MKIKIDTIHKKRIDVGSKYQIIGAVTSFDIIVSF